MNQRAFLIHQILIYSFTNKDQCPEFFTELIINKTAQGQLFLNIVQIKCQYLLRYLIASILLLKEKDKYSDSFTQFIEAVYEEFDFKKARELIKKIAVEAQDDLLLKPFAEEIQLQATILVYLVESQIFKSVQVSQIGQDSGKD
jgi:hypothetical protein